MPKLRVTVVGGPKKGQSFTVHENGETSIGRLEGNDIILPSNRVSKRHCVLVVNNSEIRIQDQGSSGGTFVNGVLTKTRKIKPGDKLSLGDYVLEISQIIENKKNLALVSQTQNAGFPMGMDPMNPMLGGQAALPGQGASTDIPQISDLPPTDLKGKAKFYFERYVLNFLYNLNETQEWRVLLAGMFVVMTFACAVLSVFPVLEKVNEKLSNESKARALLLARQIAERNAPFLYEKMETKTEVNFVEKEPGVQSAYLMDLEGRILAPARRLNQYLSDPNEAAFGSEAREVFSKNDKLLKRTSQFGEIVAAAVPVQMFIPTSGKNQTVALGVVFFDRTQVMIDSGTESLAYIQAIIFCAIVAILIYFSVYSLSLKPMLHLNSEIDHVLKGHGAEVNKKFKMEEIDPLVDVVNATLQRALSASGQGQQDSGPSLEDYSAVLKYAVSTSSDLGVMILNAERKIQFISSYFEEVSGIRSDSAIGSDVGSVARDAAFGAFVEDLLAKAPPIGSEPYGEDFEFSGVNYKMESISLGQMGAGKGFAITAKKA